MNLIFSYFITLYNFNFIKSIFFINILEFKKELFRKCNKIDAKLDRIDGRLSSLEDKLKNGINYETKEHLDIEEFVSFPLETKEAVEKLELDLQDADFFKDMVRYSIFYCNIYLI